MIFGFTGKSSRRRPKGQVLVEIVLVLPVFLFFMFLVMEICNICFQALLATHLAFECAHGAALADGPSNYGSGGGGGQGKATSVLQSKVGNRPGVFVTVLTVGTGTDPQTGRATKDLTAIVNWRVKFIFPGMQAIMTLGGFEDLNISVPMTVETPAYG